MQSKDEKRGGYRRTGKHVTTSALTTSKVDKDGLYSLSKCNLRCEMCSFCQKNYYTQTTKTLNLVKYFDLSIVLLLVIFMLICFIIIIIYILYTKSVKFAAFEKLSTFHDSSYYFEYKSID